MRSTWDLFQEMNELRKDVETLFEGRGASRWTAPWFRYSFLPGRSARVYPLVNVCEDDANVYIDALAPGLNPDSLNISTVHNQLTISGEKPALNGGIKVEDYHRCERAAGRFIRTLTLPAEVESGKATADYRNGILAISLPKTEMAKPKQIPIQVI